MRFNKCIVCGESKPYTSFVYDRCSTPETLTCKECELKVYELFLAEQRAMDDEFEE